MDSLPDSRERGYEVSDVSVRPILLLSVAIVAGTLAALATVRLMMRGPQNAPAAFGVADRSNSFTSGPHEQSSIQRSWAELEQELEKTLPPGPDWIDQKAGVVRVPIERAMDLVTRESGGAP